MTNLDSILKSGDITLPTMVWSKLRETVEDRGSWCATVHGVAKSQTRFSDWTTTGNGDESSFWTRKLRYQKNPLLKVHKHRPALTQVHNVKLFECLGRAKPRNEHKHVPGYVSRHLPEANSDLLGTDQPKVIFILRLQSTKNKPKDNKNITKRLRQYTNEKCQEKTPKPSK